MTAITDMAQGESQGISRSLTFPSFAGVNSEVHDCRGT